MTGMRRIKLTGSSHTRERARISNAAPELYDALVQLLPHLDAIVCFASTAGEHEPNRIAVDARAAVAKAQGVDPSVLEGMA